MLIPKSCLLFSFFKTMGKNDLREKTCSTYKESEFSFNLLYQIICGNNFVFSIKSMCDAILNKCKQIGSHDKIL